MGFLSTTPEDEYRQQALGGDRTTSQLPGPGLFEGALSSPVRGVVSGLAHTGQMLNDTGVLNTPADWDREMQGLKDYAKTGQSGYLALADQQTTKGVADQGYQAANRWADLAFDPNQTGAVGRTVAGVSQGLTEAAVGSTIAGPYGAAALLGTSQGYAEYLKGRQDGLDESTATEQAVATGLFSAAGAFLPMKYGKSLLSGVAGGAATNVTFGALDRFTASHILSANGYTDMAAQYRTLDGDQMAADAILGAAFGAWGHATERPSPSEVDAAAAAASDVHYRRSAPGLATTEDAAMLHGRLMDQAVNDVLNDRPVSVDPEDAKRVLSESVDDPMHDTGAALRETTFQHIPEAEHLLADVPMKPEAERPVLPEATGVQPEVPEGETAPERPQSALSPLHQDVLDKVVAQHGDTPIHLDDGTETTFNEVAARLRKESDNAQNDAKLHEVAVNCFLRNGGEA